MARILFVNDDADLAYVCKVLLESRGHVVEAVTGAERALANVEAFAPDIVIIDYIVGDRINGAELADLLRRRHRLTIPIVMLAAQRQEATLAQSAAVDAIIPKPFMSDELLAAVDRLLLRSQQAV